MPNTHVLYKDLKTGIIMQIPIDELAPGCLPVRIDDCPDIVWVDSRHLGERPVQQSSLPNPLKKRIRALYPFAGPFLKKTRKEWMDGFLKERAPEREVAAWERMALWFGVFSQSTPPESLQTLFHLLLWCTMTPADQMRHLAGQYQLSPKLKQAVLDSWYCELAA